MSITEVGRVGEQWARRWLKAQGFQLFQLDWIASNPDCYPQFYVGVEVKHQERFVAPPFDGHGLPKWQVEARLKLEERTGIRAMLIVRDKQTEEVFWQWLSALESGEHHDTHGQEPRRIYPISSFNLDIPIL